LASFSDTFRHLDFVSFFNVFFMDFGTIVDAIVGDFLKQLQKLCIL
jgi:hypothetical protein